MTTISDGTDTVTPTAVLGWESRRPVRNIVHDIIGRPDPDVTLRAAGLRSGRLTLLVDTLTDAALLETMHSAAGTLTLASTEHPGLGMEYVATGEVTVRLADTTTRWLVETGFQEIES